MHVQHPLEGGADRVIEPVPEIGGPARDLAPTTTIRVHGIKPRLRGIPDLVACLFVVPAAGLLMGMARPGAATIGAIVYTVSLALLFGVSASYHVPLWPARARAWWRRADHSAIYILIAGSYTPACLLALPEHGRELLVAVWVVAGLGLLKCFFWESSPRWLNTTLYLAFGWMIAPLGVDLWHGAGSQFFVLISAGGLLYSVGAVVYAKRLFDLDPTVFGYHEVFHLFVIAATIFHYIAVWGLVV